MPTSICKLFLYYSIQATERTCETDSDCDTSNCEYCLSGGHCTEYNREYCDSSPCGLGDGDCDPGTCSTGLVCGDSNFLEFHPLLSNCTSGNPKTAEVCIKKGILVILYTLYSLAICCKKTTCL